VLCQDDEIDVSHLLLTSPPSDTSPLALTPRADPLHSLMASYEKERVINALRESKGNQTVAARLLGVSRTTLCKKIRTYGISTPVRRRSSAQR
jgi:transcriptional regulator of acetoin/glycerol metabolism